MYEIKYSEAFCSRFTKRIKISYIHLYQKDKLINDDIICAEAKISYTCLEHTACPERKCNQNNYFGVEYLKLL